MKKTRGPKSRWTVPLTQRNTLSESVFVSRITPLLLIEKLNTSPNELLAFQNLQCSVEIFFP